MTLQQQLDEAKSAYHDLVIGKAVVELVDGNGERVRYSSANRQALASYIADLELRIAEAPICSGPMRPFFL